MASENLFPSIGSIAEQTEHLEGANEHAKEGTADEERAVQEIESLCMNCHQDGMTRLLLTSIPYFKEIIVMSFRCEHCGFQNNEIQSAGAVRDHGVTYTARILNRKDLNRQLVKSATCTVTIPEFELTIPAAKGQLTTVEGLLRDTMTDLSADQPLRKYQNPAVYDKIQAIIEACREILADEEDEEGEGEAQTKPARAILTDDDSVKPFTVKADDPAGNSFIEFYGNMSDPKWNFRTYNRTAQQNVDLGLAAPEVPEAPVAIKTTARNVDIKSKEEAEELILNESVADDDEEIFVFPGTCSSCSAPLNTLMKKVQIPYFKDILIMSTNCERCGYRDNEVKSGAAISDKGKRITLKVEDAEDLNRDILKSETCGITIPEIDLALQPGTLGGRFTTIEGLLEQVYEELSEKVFAGDSKVNDQSGFEKFLAGLKAIKNAEKPFTLIVEDPLANSYLQNTYAPDPDPNMTIELFDRTWEQNEELGLNDIKVENYEEDAPSQEPPKETT